MELLPAHIDVDIKLVLAFSATTILTLWLWLKAVRRHPTVGMLTMLWFLIQLFAGYFGFYTFIEEHPERLPLMAGPPLALVFFIVLNPSMNGWIKSLDMRFLTWIHIVRIPVEICLYSLFIAQTIPVEMTFEGRNFDILAGFTAPLIWWFAVKTNPIRKKLLLWWNIVSLILLLNIVVTAILSLPLPIQLFGHTQPNIAILYFPFNWLPSVIVPLVLFSHLLVIKRLLLLDKTGRS